MFSFSFPALSLLSLDLSPFLNLCLASFVSCAGSCAYSHSLPQSLVGSLARSLARSLPLSLRPFCSPSICLVLCLPLFFPGSSSLFSDCCRRPFSLSFSLPLAPTLIHCIYLPFPLPCNFPCVRPSSCPSARLLSPFPFWHLDNRFL